MSAISAACGRARTLAGRGAFADARPGGSVSARTFPPPGKIFAGVALWGSDDPGFIDRLFRWIGSHGRTRMVIYNQGALANGPFQLSQYLNAARALRGWPASSRFPASAPEFAG